VGLVADAGHVGGGHGSTGPARSPQASGKARVSRPPLSSRDRLYRLWRYANIARRLWHHDRDSVVKVPLRRRLWLYRRGFLSRSEVQYELFKNDPTLYVTDVEREKCWSIARKSAPLVENKQFFAPMFEHLIRVPLNIAMVRRGELRSLRAELHAGRPITLTEIAASQLCPEGIVLKPVDGGGGKGIVILPRGEDGRLLHDGEPIEGPALDALADREGLLAVERLKQSDWATSLNPRSTNSMRILTMVDPDTGEGFIARAVQRIGVEGTGMLDNFSRGGLTVPVDIERGVLLKGATFWPHEELRRHSVHPDHGRQLEGLEIPHWAELRQQLERIASLFPMMPYLGWDIIHMEDGFAAIEANINSDTNVFQLHGPLLADPRIKRFYEYHRICTHRRWYRWGW
jgi:hypothetical protein